MNYSNSFPQDVKHSPQLSYITYKLKGWLIAIPIKELSGGAKILYARLEAWKGKRKEAYRSVANLAAELQTSPRTISRHACKQVACG